MKKPILLIILVLLIDQISKIYIKTHFMLGDEFRVTDWFIIHFTENNGMAFGTEFGGDNGKLFLSVFRIFAVMGIFYWLYTSVRDNASKILIFSVALIFAGALGNIIDSLVYGVVFNDSSNQIASFMPEGGGYAPALFGKVVDMLYFPLWKGFLPNWIPFWGGDYFIFFQPIFNIADSSIFIGVVTMFIFQKRVFDS
ncbi:MAG: lipoprotein signal peptidase [Flavobacteriales bacterium]|nr:lipoprotein signal peptidase [Flavobacteriales bacterium]